MDGNVPNDVTIRAYLLGQIESDVREEDIEELMLSNEEFSEHIDVIEDEIIEEYVEGTLSAADKKAVESHFLRPQERQRKLEEARLLNRCFSAATRNSLSAVPKATREWYMPLSVVSHSQIQSKMYVGIAALVLLSLLSGYLFWSRRQLEVAVLRLNQSLVEESERSSTLDQQVRAEPMVAPPIQRSLAVPIFAPTPSVLLSLVQPGIRGEATLPALRIGSTTTTIHVEIALPSARGGEYNVRLETTQKIAWQREKIQSFSSQDGAILIFDVPAQVFAAGESRFIISQKTENETSYSFTTSRQ